MVLFRKFVFALLSLNSVGVDASDENDLPGYPVAIFHGMSMTATITWLEAWFYDSQLHGKDGWDFRPIEYAAGSKTWTVPMVDQVDTACKAIQNLLETNSKWKSSKGIGFISHSNGAMVARGVLQYCDLGDVKVRKYVSLGGPQRGIDALPSAYAPLPILQNMTSTFIRKHFLEPWWIQHISAAAYVYDPDDLSSYKKGNSWLAKLNNEASDETLNSNNRAKVTSLEGMLLVKFKDDTVVRPKGSEWFGQEQGEGDIVPVENTGSFWENDVLGIRQLNQTGRLHMLEAPTKHDQAGYSFFAKKVVPFLKGEWDPKKTLIV